AETHRRRRDADEDLGRRADAEERHADLPARRRRRGARARGDVSAEAGGRLRRKGQPDRRRPHRLAATVGHPSERDDLALKRQRRSGPGDGYWPRPNHAPLPGLDRPAARVAGPRRRRADQGRRRHLVDRVAGAHQAHHSFGKPVTAALRQFPNFLTAIRVVLAPLTAYLVLQGQDLFALCVFAFAGASDALDGFLARRFALVSRFGEYLDPAADKLLMLACFVTLTMIQQTPLWLTAIVIGRDIAIVLGVLLAWSLSLPLKVE